VANPVGFNGDWRSGPEDPRLAADPLWQTKVKDIWRFLLRQPLSYWLVCIYLFFEYVRPQSIYESISFFPWAQATIFLCLGVLLLERGIPRFSTVISGLLGLYSLVVILSSLMAVRPDVSWAGIDLYFSWVLIYLLITNTVTTERRYFVFLLSFLLYSLKMSQHGARIWIGIGFGFQSWGATGAPGWFQNSGEFGIQMCIFLPLALHFIWAVKPYLPRWKLGLLWVMPVTAMMSIIASSSRGALVGAGLVGLWMGLRSRHRVRTGVGLAVVVVVVILVIPQQQKDRLSAMGEDGTSVSRLTMWEDGVKIAGQYPVLGIGYDNWSSYYTSYAGIPLLPHNIFIEALAELGYSGLLSFLLLIGGTFFLNSQTRARARALGEGGRFLHHSAMGLDAALVGYVGSGFFVTVLYYPFFWINLSMTVALHLATLRKAGLVPRSQSRKRPLASSIHGFPVG